MGSRADNQLFRHENSLKIPAAPGAGRTAAEKPRNPDTSKEAAFGLSPIEKFDSAQLTRLVCCAALGPTQTGDDAVLTRTLPLPKTGHPENRSRIGSRPN